MSGKKVRINFAHDARPYLTSDDYSNLEFDFTNSAIPQVGDDISLPGITNPRGTYFVCARHFEIKENGLVIISLTLNLAE